MSEEIKENRNIDKDTTIYEFFKEHQSMFIACISGFITVLSFFVSTLNDMSMRITLQEYAIIPEMIKNNEQGNLFYSIVCMIGYCVAVFIIQGRIIRLLRKYYIYTALERFLSVDEIKKYDKDNRFHKQTNNNKTKDRIDLIFRILIYIIPLSIPVILSYLTRGYDLTTSLISVVITFMMIVVGGIIVARRNTKEYRKKKMESIIKKIKDENEDEQQHSNNIQCFEKLFNKAISEMIPKRKITNEQIKFGLIAILCIIIYSFFMVLLMSATKVKTQKNYQIYTDDEGAYAVVYQNADYYVLEKAMIEGNRLTIYRDKQRYMISNDLYIDYISFEDVIKIDIKKEQEQKNEEEFDNNQNNEIFEEQMESTYAI